MDTQSRRPLIEQVTLSFGGLDADKGVIDIHDLARALEGWRTFWETSAAIYYNKELSLKPLPQDMRPQIRVRAFERQSFDVLTNVIIPITLMVSYDVIKTLWKWRKALMRRHIDSKREFFTREEALAALKALARDHEIEGTNTTEVVKVMDTLDDALLDLAQPIDRSAKTITISSSVGDPPIRLSSKDKRALSSGYHVDASLRSRGFEKYSVKFVRINTETGKSLITFDEPHGLHQTGHEYAQIIDAQVSRARNVYTRALYEGESVEVWARMVRSEKSNDFVRWEISADLPPEDTPLFDGMQPDGDFSGHV